MPLSLLLREAGVQQGATWIVAEGADASGNERSIPMAKAMDDVLVAYGQNGEALRPENGSAAHRSGLGGQRQHEVAAPHQARGPALHDADGKHEARRPHAGRQGATAQFVMEKSVITSPSGGQRLPDPGFYEIQGLAWSGRGLVRRVEVSTDGGKTWRDAQEPVLPARAHALPARLAMGRARGRPPVAVHRRDRLRTADAGRAGQGPRPELVYFNNAIQSWKVAADGSVHNVHA